MCAVLYCSSVFKGIHCPLSTVDSVLFLTQATGFFLFSLQESGFTPASKHFLTDLDTDVG